MQRITKFSALIGFLAVITFAISLFMFAPSFTGHSFSSATPDAFAAVTGGGGTGCSGCGGGTSGNGGDNGSKAAIPPIETLPSAPTCTLNAAPTSVNQGQSSTLHWTTTNAISVSINQGIGGVAANSSTLVTPLTSITYRLTATGAGGTITCDTPITVVPPVVVPNPSCAIDAVPTTITVGQKSKLSWSTYNVTSVSIDPGIGAVALNAVNDNKDVYPTVTTTYTLTASGNGKTVTCPKTIIVTPVVVGLSCDLFNASPSSLGVGGGNTTLTWKTTGASSVTIDQGVGSNLGVDSSRSVNVGSTKTFTLTATNAQGRQVQCSTQVVVDTDRGCTSNCGGGGCTSNCGGGGGGSYGPVCQLFHTSSHDVSLGQAVTLSWETLRGRELVISDNFGKEVFNTTNSDEIRQGSIGVNPKRDSVYTLRVTKEGRSASCDVTVNVNDGGFNVTTVRDRQPVTTITFRDVPYTGFDAGPMLAGLFYALLAVWALVAAYVVVVKRGSVMGFSLATAGFAPKTSLAYALPVVTRVATPTTAPRNLPVAEDDEETEEEEVVGEDDDMANNDEENASLENRAFKAGMILSKDAVASVKRAGNTLAERITILDAVLARAKESFPREDGWIALDRARISSLFN